MRGHRSGSSPAGPAPIDLQAPEASHPKGVSRRREPGSYAGLDLRQTLDTVGGELAQREAAAIRTRLASVERVDGEVPPGALDEKGTLERINLLSSLLRAMGPRLRDRGRYAAQRDEIIRNVSQEAKKAIENEDYERTQDLLGTVQEVNPEDETARQQKCEVDGKVIVKRFVNQVDYLGASRMAA